MEKQVPIYGKTRLSIYAILALILANFTLLSAQSDIFTISHDNTRVREMVFSTNGKMLIVKSGDEVQNSSKGVVVSPCIHLWEMETKRKTMAIADREFGRASCISADGSMIAFKEKNNIQVMDLATRKVTSSVKLEDSKFARPIAFCNDKRGIVVEQGNKATIWDVQTDAGRPVRDYAAPGVNHYITPNDAYAVETFGDSFRLIDFKTGQTLKDFALQDKGKSETLRGVVFSPDNRFLATLSDNKVRVWDMEQHQAITTFNVLPKDAIYCFSADGRYMFGGTDTMKIWELRSKKEFATTIVTEGKISSIAVSPDIKYLACGDTRGNIKLWELSDENLSEIYFAREISNEVKQIPEKKEFEKTDDYSKRKQKLIRNISNKYLTQYIEKLTTENTIMEQWEEERIIRETQKSETIKLSRRQIEFKIDSISPYNADKESFQIKMVNTQERYSKWETIKVPLRDNPQCFKQKAAQLPVIGTIQMTEDMRGYEIYNIRIKSSCTGKEKEYPFGPQRKYLDE